ncbi:MULTISPECIES: NAD-dependent malic enzyme [unclassified Paenibacillus]|uniref:NAD-dependent malic enzyme n=1 Tax=Paenibacillus provencensis TaxID=441151 RepID=A0ABW3PLL1_9BACL|nr:MULTISPECIES: NAD-dependent malic enzyme [unclassified Paenibacillus]MCM3130283.1 NAD-dependent malic enzyme [Paenibacillus sp. MER 78]SFS46733.1 malate dehydrogenase (oxaloacetate-decarboxylating) [Paenibacillus sp. 453mf]
MIQRNLDGNSIIIRLEMKTKTINFGEVASAISQAGGDIVAIDVISTNQDITVRDLTVAAAHADDNKKIVEAVRNLNGVSIINVSDRTFLLHLGGKIEIAPKTPINNREDLSRVYTPDVARVCNAIAEEPQKAYSLTIKRNTVAVVSDGSAVLGLGNIGPRAAMPVMEGKAMLFKQLAGVDAFPICLETQDTEEIIRTIKAISPAFGGINLEDISSPRCFEIERRLNEELDIPVFHDDQHGTAVVLYAGLINALKLVGKSIENTKIVVCGIGAAGVACSNILLSAGARNLIGVDREGALVKTETYDNPIWQDYAGRTNPHLQTGSLHEVIKDADIFIGLSRGNLLTREHIKTMAKDPIVFAMANPVPEIMPSEVEDIVAVMATGRSDYPNQINNVLCFPGMFRAALDCRAIEINEAMKLAAATAIASSISDEERTKYYIIPSVFNDRVVKSIREKVVEAALQTGVARRVPRKSSDISG